MLLKRGAVCTDSPNKNPPDIQPEGYFVTEMRGAEGQGRTDTALPLPVHESGASYIS